VAAPGEHRPLAAALGLGDEAAERLSLYLDLLASWSERTNLTAARTPAARFDLLVRPVVPLVPRLAGGNLLDVGSGNGSPGLVLAALRADVRATLLEPRMRRWAFLREASRAMGLEVDVRRQRHDEYDGPAAETVTVRALRLPPGEMAPLVAPGGRLVVFGVPPPAHPDLVPEDWGLPGVHVFRRNSCST
jgi:16S rRNA (guanine527-N7)-methyltransferase